ncbi:hypothetical protein VAE151_500295 [Vibrio aestuarianus]|uniref:Uncharacterized protein n=1 Tax=Vibrio aestuarianus TaxID=28171 RepID=A0ABN8TNH8_9VIBR|nr:hypothetical protein VAE032_220296 [Vibrio aestuarianus]CAH8184271.1 hypothetical protein VAE055_320297 [Vibrio aestuarianus]CAH8184371.1 hypothetical protein VAE128_420297 [Vibrio aestuarianus]CAH8184413.1 hypothetical protein VAE130_530295 [Vibrio aestuarianus]CAH8184503.1 hypothetical protein VAE115_270297 [Vibrio aestuarianus]
MEQYEHVYVAFFRQGATQQIQDYHQTRLLAIYGHLLQTLLCWHCFEKNQARGLIQPQYKALHFFLGLYYFFPTCALRP